MSFRIWPRTRIPVEESPAPEKEVFALAPYTNNPICPACGGTRFHWRFFAYMTPELDYQVYTDYGSQRLLKLVCKRCKGYYAMETKPGGLTEKPISTENNA